MHKRDYNNQEALLPQPVRTGFTDHIFSSPSSVPLELRLWACPNAKSGSPWILWTHGGAYCTGAHYAPPSWVVPAFQSRGFHVVSIGYRLSPQVGLGEMIQDCVEGFKWCRANLEGILGKAVDVEAYAVGGDSSGGTLATMLGHMLDPQPRAVCDVYGPVDLVDLYFARKKKVPDDGWAKRWGDRYTEGENQDMINDRDPAKAIIAAPFGWEIENVPIEQTRIRWGRPEFEYTPRVRSQTQLKDWMGSMGNGLTVLLRLDELEREDDRVERCRTWSAYHLLKEEGRRSYPPTAFFHGAGDGAVPIAVSRRMAEELKRQGVEVLESYEPGAPHGFDQEFKGPETEGWDEYVVPVVDFIDSQTRRAP